MQHDSGEVLQGLASKWSFMGATMIEWGCGMVMFFIVSLFGDSPASGMPLMLLAMVLTAYSLAGLRKSFPDEERGVRNAFMTACGFAPQDIPPPAALQPVWSQSPLRELPLDCKYLQMGMDKFFMNPNENYLIPEE